MLAETEYRFGIRKLFLLVCLLSIATNMFLSIYLTVKDKNYREVLIPPTIDKSFWVDNTDISAEGLEQMATFLLLLAQNNTPVTAKHNAELLLKYIDPSAYGLMSRSLLAAADYMNKTGTSSFYSIGSVSVNQKEKSVLFSGQQLIYLIDKNVLQKQKSFLIKFRYVNGKTSIIDMKEVNNDGTPIPDSDDNLPDIRGLVPNPGSTTPQGPAASPALKN